MLNSRLPAAAGRRLFKLFEMTEKEILQKNARAYALTLKGAEATEEGEREHVGFVNGFEAAAGWFWDSGWPVIPSKSAFIKEAKRMYGEEAHHHIAAFEWCCDWLKRRQRKSVDGSIQMMAEQYGACECGHVAHHDDLIPDPDSNMHTCAKCVSGFFSQMRRESAEIIVLLMGQIDQQKVDLQAKINDYSEKWDPEGELNLMEI